MGIASTEISVKLVSDVLVQGEATAATRDATGVGSITVLGVTFGIDADTDFEDENDMPVTVLSEIDNLISAILTPPQLVKVVDNENIL